MTGNGPASNAARRSSWAESWSMRGMPSRSQSACPDLSPLELVVDDALESLVGLRAAQESAVDEEGGSARDSCHVAVLDVGIDQVLVLVCFDARVEFRGVEADAGGRGLEIHAAELRRIGEQ